MPWRILEGCIFEDCPTAWHSGRWEIGCGVRMLLHSQSSCTSMTHPRLGALLIFITLKMQGIWCQSWMGHCIMVCGFNAVWLSQKLPGFLFDTYEGTLWELTLSFFWLKWLWGITCWEWGTWRERGREREIERERETERGVERESETLWESLGESLGESLQNHFEGHFDGHLGIIWRRHTCLYC